MKTFKFIIAYIFAVLAFMLVIAEIDTAPIVFYAIKLSSIAVAYKCVKVMCNQHIINLDE